MIMKQQLTSCQWVLTVRWHCILFRTVVTYHTNRFVPASANLAAQSSVKAPRPPPERADASATQKDAVGSHCLRSNAAPDLTPPPPEAVQSRGDEIVLTLPYVKGHPVS